MNFFYWIFKNLGTLEDSLDEGFYSTKKLGVRQPKRNENAKILIGNTPMDTDKIKVFGSLVKVYAISKVWFFILKYLNNLNTINGGQTFLSWYFDFCHPTGLEYILILYFLFLIVSLHKNQSKSQFQNTYNGVPARIRMWYRAALLLDIQRALYAPLSWRWGRISK